MQNNAMDIIIRDVEEAMEIQNQELLTLPKKKGLATHSVSLTRTSVSTQESLSARQNGGLTQTCAIRTCILTRSKADSYAC